MLGEMLCAGFATQNFSWIGSPAATELETVKYHSCWMLLHNVLGGICQQGRKKRKDYAFQHQVDEKPSIIPGFLVSMAHWCQFVNVVMAWFAGLMTYACR